MGLGLPIVSEIATEHGGTVSIEDNEPRGSRFVIDLPVARDPGHGGGRSVAGEHILIVDDERGHPERRLRGVLEDEGYRVTAVGTGADALKAVGRRDAGPRLPRHLHAAAWTAWRRSPSSSGCARRPPW